jgi:hypothetical protein
MSTGRRRGGTAALALLAALSALPAACLAVTSPYVRPAPRATLPLHKGADDDADGQTPQQVRPRLCFNSVMAAASAFRRAKPDQALNS